MVNVKRFRMTVKNDHHFTPLLEGGGGGSWGRLLHLIVSSKGFFFAEGNIDNQNITLLRSPPNHEELIP